MLKTTFPFSEGICWFKKRLISDDNDKDAEFYWFS